MKAVLLDDEAKKLLKIKFPRGKRPKPYVYKAGRPVGRPLGYKVTSQKQLRALKRGAVPEGAVLNPYGHYGNTHRGRYRATYFKLDLKPAYRPLAMKRTRLRLKEKKAQALEAHEVQQVARENASLAMKTLAEISGNKRAPESSRIAASSVILDRAYGKASQTSITASVSNGKESEIDSVELDKRIKQALKRVEDLTNRAPKAGTGKDRPARVLSRNQLH